MVLKYIIIKKYFYKENFDFEQQHITLNEFHPQLRVLFAINGIFFNNENSLIRFVWPFLSCSLSLIASTFELMIIFHAISVEDFSLATECFAYLVIILVVPIIYSSVLLNKAKIKHLLRNMDNHFGHICSLEKHFRNIFLFGQLRIWKLSLMWLIFIILAFNVFSWTTALALMYYSLLATQDEHMVRPLMFPIWLPKDDPTRTPNYEIFLFLEYIMLVVTVLSFGVYVYILFHLLLHYYNQLDMIMIAFRMLFEGLNEDTANLDPRDPQRIQTQGILSRKIKQIVKWHINVIESVDIISSIYGPVLVYQVLFSAIAICLTAYQVADQLEHGILNVIFMILMVGACLQLWIPCYVGTLIQYKATDIGAACWNCGWQGTSLGQLVRKDIIIILMKSQQPLTIQFVGTPDFTLETFSSIMSSAYSYFNMLRQMREEL